MAKRVKGILFDLGETLLDFGKVDIPLLFEAGARLAYDYLTELGHSLPSFASYHRRQLWAIRWRYLRSRFTRKEFNAMDVLGRISGQMGNNLTRDEALELAWLWYKPLSECAVVEEGLIGMLSRFQSEGITLGLISNTFIPGEAIDRHLATENLLDLLSVRVYSCDVRFRKPNPSIFRIALERAQLNPSETLFVGDSPHADVRGANAAGMISVLKDSAGKHASTSVGADHCIRNITELSGIVAEYNNAG